MIVYSRKVRVAAHESVEIGLHHEFRHMPYEEAFKWVRNQVEKWLAEEATRILVAKGSQPPEYY